MNEQFVDLVKYAKILAVILSNDLKWNEHVHVLHREEIVEDTIHAEVAQTSSR